MNHRTRRTLSVTMTLFAVGLTASAAQWVHNRLGDTATLTGWTLLVSTAGLYLLSWRKRTMSARLGPVAAWLQVHVYMGSFASVVFLMHIGWPVRGIFEIFLAVGFVFVAGSGVVLGVMSRTSPRRLAAIAVDRRLEQIPAICVEVARAAHDLALASANVGEGATLAEYYQQSLLPFFQSPRSWLYRLLPSGLQRRRLLRELDDLQRYLAQQGNEARSSLAAMVKTKDDLDYQYAVQSRLRTMYALHISLTWALVMMIGVHVVLVYRFQGAL
jgi:hypothetical protein